MIHGQKNIKLQEFCLQLCFFIYIFYPIDFSNVKFEDFDFSKEVMVNVYLSLFF